MRKALALFLAVILAAALFGCGKSEPQSDGPAADAKQDEGQKNEAAATMAPEKQEEKAPEIVYQEVGPDRPIEDGALVLSFTDVKVAKNVFTTYGKEEGDNTVNVFRPVQAGVGNKLIILAGTVKNAGDQELFLRGNVFVSVVVDGGDPYSGRLTVLKKAAHSASTVFSIEPLNEAEMYITAEVPEAVADGLGICDFIIGFHKDGLDVNRAGTNAKDAEFKYKLSASTAGDAAIPVARDTFAPEVYQLGTTLSSDTVELTFTEIVKKTKMSDEYKGKSYSFAGDAAEGSHNLCLVGTVMQKASYPLKWVRFKGDVTIDGYTYETTTWVLGKTSNKLQPMMEAKVYLFANVPDTLLDSFQECTFRFAYNEEFTNLWYEYEECDHAYTLTFGPGDVK